MRNVTAYNSNGGWYGVDLDGTIAHYSAWEGPTQIGEPIMPMVRRVKKWLAEGKSVRIFTARVDGSDDAPDVAATRKAVEDWCEQHIGVRLPVTNKKDMKMVELWDDRAIQVVANTGMTIEEVYGG